MADKKTTLPVGWRWTKLMDVANVVNGFGFPEYLQGKTDLPYPFIKVSDMNQDGAEIFVSNAKHTVDNQILKTLGGRVYPAGTVIFPKVGGALLTNKKRILGKQASFDNNIMGVIPINVTTDWIYYWLLTIDLKTISNTQALPSIKQSVVANLKIPLPPLDEQQRIAARLNEQMATVARARQAAEEQLRLARELPATYFREVFESKEAQKWQRQKLGKICEITARQIDPKIPEYGALPHVNGENIESGTCQLLYLNSASDEGMTSQKYLFDPGDVLYSKLRPYLRKVIVVDFKGVCSADMYPIKVNSKELDSEFLMWLLVSDEFTKYADGESRRARMPKLNREQLFAWETLLPRISEQKLIAAYLTGKIGKTKQLAQTIATQLSEINNLPAALLRQVFSA